MSLFDTGTMSRIYTSTVRVIFGGDPRENARRYEANMELKAIADLTYPWTEGALRQEIARWLAEGPTDV